MGMQRSRTGWGVTALIVLVTACEDGATVGPDDGALEAGEVEFLAEETESSFEGLFESELVLSVQEASADGVLLSLKASEPLVTTFEFERERPCRGGGSVTVEGEGQKVADRDSHTVELTVAGEKKIEDCARQRGDVVITTNGEAEFELFRRKVEGEFDGLQTTDVAGEISYETSDGRSGECEFDLHVVGDPDAGTKTITGTFCDREVDRVIDWNP